MIPDQSLVNTPEANEFVGNTKLPTQRNVMLGNLDKFKNDDTAVYNAISASHQQLERAADTITRLASDGSRNEVEKHAAAKKVADSTIAQLEKTRTSILALSEGYMRGANERLAEVFKLPEGRSAIHADMARWIREQAKNGDGGYTKIKNAVTTNDEFAKVLHAYPSELLDLPFDQQTDFLSKAVERWSPESLAAMDRANLLRDTAAKYPATIAKVKTSFYNPLKAAKIHQRVAV